VVFIGQAVGTVTPKDGSIVSSMLADANLEMPNTLDLNGKELILDADADTSITADTDDQIDIKIAGSDNLRIKANEIENVSGNFEIDSAGDIVLDADLGDIIFKDAGVSIGRLINSSTDFVIQSDAQDKDIIFKGDDGGSTITAMTIDMSAAGRVGIGVTAPSDKLTVGGITDPRIAVRMSSGGDNNTARMIVQTNGTASTNADAFTTYDNNAGSATGTKWMVGVDASATSFKIAAADLGNFDGTNEYFNITSSGILQLSGGGNDNVGELNFGNTAQDDDRLQIRHQSNAWIVKTVDSEPLLFGTANTEAMRIDNSGNITKPLQPSFHAYPSSSTNYTSADDVIIFGSTYHNIGSDYNTSTGKFTAPIAGNYLFAWAVYRGDGDDSASIHLLHNTTKKYEGRIDSSGAGGYATIAGSLVIALSASDTVHLQVRYPTIHVNSPWSYFSGTLLS
jgi:hypothetical protein